MPFRRDPVRAVTIEPDAVVEAPRRTRLRADVDVLVCGGGPAGVGAALAAARSGASTLLVERFGMLGGTWTAGLVNPFFEALGRGWIVDDLIERLKAAGAWRVWRFAHTFDPEGLRRTLESMMLEAGVELLYYTHVADTIVVDDRVRGVVIESKAGREAITAKVVIDATGDGDVAARAGCEYEFGRPSDGFVQPMTLMFEIRGVGGFEQENAPALHDLLVKAIEDHDLGVELPFGREHYVPWIITTPSPGSAAVQHTHVYRLNPLDPGDLTRGTIDARRQAAEAVEVFRRVPGLEAVEMVGTAAAIGIREARRVKGKYWLTLDDLAEGRRFDDAVTFCAFGIDIHEPAPGSEVKRHPGVRSSAYEIPYRSFVPEAMNGLLLAGRCISGSHEAHASYRVTGTAMGMGQAAGLAGAWCVADGIEPGAIDGAKLRAALAEKGVGFLDGA